MRVYIYIYIYKCECTYAYACIHIYISATALCAFGVTGCLTVLSDCCYPNFCFLLILAPSQNPHRREISEDLGSRHPAWAAFENHSCCYKSLQIVTISLS